MVMALARL